MEAQTEKQKFNVCVELVTKSVSIDQSQKVPPHISEMFSLLI